MINNVKMVHKFKLFGVFWNQYQVKIIPIKIYYVYIRKMYVPQLKLWIKFQYVLLLAKAWSAYISFIKWQGATIKAQNSQYYHNSLHYA